MNMKFKNRPTVGCYLVSVLLGVAYSMNSSAATTKPSQLKVVKQTTPGVMEHCDDTVAGGSFLEIFDCGDELFEIRYNAVDGVGMGLGDGGRFTRVPRADLVNWQATMPRRTTGPNAEACNVCHLTETIGGAGDGAGPAALNVIRDPQHTGRPDMFIQRNVPHLFGMAGPQLVAEEMTEELHALRQSAIDSCEKTGRRSRVKLITKGIDFGVVTARKSGGCSNNLHIKVKGVADDLVVRPFQWQGTTASVREFSRDAFHNEMGMNPVEMVGDGIDGDFDGVTDEVSIADVTAMAVYLAAQPRPTTLLELDDLRTDLEKDTGGAAFANEMQLPDLTPAERSNIEKGEKVFADVGCTSCHTPSFTISKTVFKEPSDNEYFRDNGQFPAGQSADITPVSFNITDEMPDNLIVHGSVFRDLGNFETDADGNAIIRMYGDLKQHEMGSRLAENIDEAGNGKSKWMTKELWGLGNTAPYLHDGRATTIEEAILEHGGAANKSRKKFVRLSVTKRGELVDFLNNLVLFLPAEEE